MKPHNSIQSAISDLPDPHSDHDVPNHVPINHTAATVEQLAEIRHGTNEHPAYARAHAEDPAYTVVGGHLASPVHYDEPRRLTVRELARLQDFPDWFVFEGTKSDQYATVGECVPVGFARALGEHLG